MKHSFILVLGTTLQVDTNFLLTSNHVNLLSYWLTLVKTCSILELHSLNCFGSNMTVKRTSVSNFIFFETKWGGGGNLSRETHGLNHTSKIENRYV